MARLILALRSQGVSDPKVLNAIETTPRTCGSALNSACRSGRSEPPVPVPFGQPVWAMKPSITRWNATPS